MGKVLVVMKKVVPLHPLNEKQTSQGNEERVLWKIYINRQVVQEASTSLGGGTWVESNELSIDREG